MGARAVRMGEGGAAGIPRRAEAFTRRRWLRSIVTAIPGRVPAWVRAQARAPAPDPPGPGEAEVVEQVRAQARKAALGPIAVEKTEHFLAIGDAPARFQAEAIQICEALARAFLAS